MRVLVIGGTRFIGRHLVGELVGRGHEVTLLSRGRSPREVTAGVTPVWGEREDPAAIQRAFDSRPDAVVDNIAYEANAVASLPTENMERVRRYLLMSTSLVYLALAPGDPRTLSEEDLPLGEAPEDATSVLGTRDLLDVTRDYVKGKLAAESAAARLPAPVTVVRSCMVSGSLDPHDRIGFFATRIRDGDPILLPDGGTRPVQLGWVEDLVRWLADLLERDGAGREVFNVAPPVPRSPREIMDLCARALDRTAEAVPIETEVLRAALPTYDRHDLFGLPDPGRVLSDRLLLALPGITFTETSEWIGRVARDAATREPDRDAPDRVRERQVAQQHGNR